jgi:hypothetical protein
MRQIIKNLGFSIITCRPQLIRRNQALTNEFIAEIKKTPKSYPFIRNPG